MGSIGLQEDEVVVIHFQKVEIGFSIEKTEKQH
jgi:hypothetical protein